MYDNIPIFNIAKAKTKIAIGDIITRPDGTRWQKTSTFGYTKVVDGNSTPSGNTTSTPQKPSIPAGITLRSTEEIDEIFNKYGEKGVWQLNKYEFVQWLKDKGIQDASKLGHKEKLGAIGGILKEMKEKSRIVKYEPFSNKGVKIRNNATGEVFEFDKYFLPEIEKNARPVKGGHWGSSDSRNNYAKMIAFTSSPQYRPIDKIKDGKMQPFNYELTSKQLFEAVGLRKHAQEKVAQISREKYPNIYRGMSLDPNQVQEIISKKTDTIELTGCTAFSFYESIADRYSKSSWTQSVGGSGRVSAKIILERDDAVDTSLGMWHHSYDDRNEDKPAFETLSGLESLKIDKVEFKTPKNPIQKFESFKNNVHTKNYIKAMDEVANTIDLYKIKKLNGRLPYDSAEDIIRNYSGYSTYYDDVVDYVKDHREEWNKAHQIIVDVPKKSGHYASDVLNISNTYNKYEQDANKYQKLKDLDDVINDCDLKTTELKQAFFRIFTNGSYLQNQSISKDYYIKAFKDMVPASASESVKKVEENYNKIKEKIGSLDWYDYKRDYLAYNQPSRLLMYCRAGRGLKGMNDSESGEIENDNKK